MDIKFTNFLKLTGKSEDTVPSEAMDAALAAVAQMHDEGYVLVPSEATDDMVAAAVAASGLSGEQVRKIWAAMLAAW